VGDDPVVAMNRLSAAGEVPAHRGWIELDGKTVRIGDTERPARRAR